MPADRQLYTFLTNQIAAAIARADHDRGPAVAGWGSQRLLRLTRNRSLEAHLFNHGVEREYGQGDESLDPGGYEHTIDPAVNVLRVDKLIRRGGRTVRLPIGGWSTFANHGTVTKSSFQFYNQDHHAAAISTFQDEVRRVGRVPRSQEVVNVYGNSGEGDQSAGLDWSGPAGSDAVGRHEGYAMMAAWRQAGRSLIAQPPLDVRWTRICFCGQSVPGGQVASEPEVGLPFFTGSEEERGPLFDVTQEHFEGRRNPVASGPHGHKIGIEGIPGDVPRAVPLVAVRVGSGVVVSLPGEGTKEVAERVRQSVLGAVAGQGIDRVVVSGIANEFILYFTTPEEHDRQHYEGGQTLFGRLSSVLLQQELASLAGRLVRGEPAQAAFPLDPTNGVRPDGPPYPSGAKSGRILSQPAGFLRRLDHAELAWQGGPQGLDRPLESPFVVVERRERGRWRRARSDLGLQILWSVDGEGRYRARWEVALNDLRGVYRLVVNAKLYRLVSRTFTVADADVLTVEPAAARPGRVAVRLFYPRPVENQDLLSRPREPGGGAVTFRVGSRLVTVRRRAAGPYAVAAPGGAQVVEARDLYGNRAPAGLVLQP